MQLAIKLPGSRSDPTNVSVRKVGLLQFLTHNHISKTRFTFREALYCLLSVQACWESGFSGSNKSFPTRTSPVCVLWRYPTHHHHPPGSVVRVCVNVRDIKMFWEALHRATMWACFSRPSALLSCANSRAQNALLLVRPGSAKAKQLSEPEAHTEGIQHQGAQLPLSGN